MWWELLENQKSVKFKFFYSETCDKEVWRDCYYRKQIAIRKTESINNKKTTKHYKKNSKKNFLWVLKIYPRTLHLLQEKQLRFNQQEMCYTLLKFKLELRGKTFINETISRKRLGLAKVYIQKSMEFWNHVM